MSAQRHRSGSPFPGGCPRHLPWRWHFLGVALFLALTGCGADRPNVDSQLSVDTLAPPDSAAAPPTAAAESTAAPTAPTADRAAQVDSLQGELARLTAELATLQQPSDSAGAADSADQTGLVAQLRAGERVRETASDVRYFGLRTFWALIILALAWMLIRGTVWVLDAASERSARRRLFFKKLIPIVRLAVWGLAASYVITSVYNVDRAGLLAATAALGVGIGFAAQGVLKNFFGGLIIIFDQPFQVGDKIRVGGTYGEVVSIGMRATRIVTPDDNLVSVPNTQIVEEQVANANAGALDCQVVVDLYLPGWVDATEAKAIAYEAATNSRYVYLKKPVVVNVRDEFKETFLTHLVVKAYVLDTRYEFALASEITETAKAEFLRRGMLQPFVRQHPYPADDAAGRGVSWDTDEGRR